MIVALCTAGCQSHPCCAKSGRPIQNLVHAVFLQVRSPFAIAQRVPQKTGPHSLGNCGIGNQVSGQLLDGELVKRQVSIERIDDPLPIAPGHGAQKILQVAVAVSVVSQIKPPPRPSLAEMLRSQQSIHHAFIGVSTCVVQKRIDFQYGRWQSRQIERNPANQRRPIRS